MNPEVYISGSLEWRHPSVYSGITNALKSHGVWVNVLHDCANIWCRDFLPVQVKSERKYVRFAYDKYGGNYPVLSVPNSVYDCFDNITDSKIVLDGGGNCVSNHAGTVVITDKVFTDNPKISRAKIIKELETLLEAHVVIVPTEPDDALGHADGILNFISENMVFINDYSRMGPIYGAYEDKLKASLEINGIHHRPFPYRYDACPQMLEEEFRIEHPHADDYNPGFGYYVNYLAIPNHVVVYPTFGLRQDGDAETLLRQKYGCDVVGVDCSSLSMEGGLINCVTHNYQYKD